MRVYADRIQVERGEEWTYDVYFQNRDGSPYIVSEKLTNPYILVTIASSKYTQNGRYIANFWSKVIGTYPTFYSTQPTVIVDKNANTISEINAPDKLGITLPDVFLIDGVPVDNAYTMFSVYEWTDKNDEKHYFWCTDYKTDSNGNVTAWTYEEYSFHFVITFPTDITNTWIEQNYVFGVKLVGGTKNKEYDPNEESSRPIVTFDGVQVLVAPMQLIVTSNIAGSLPLL